MKINDAIFGAILAVLGTVVLVHVQAFPTIPGRQYGPGLFPGSIAAGFVVCGVLLIISGVRNRGGLPWVVAGEWMRSPRHVIAAGAVVAGMIAYILLAERVGFLITAPVLLLFWFRAFGVVWKTAIVAAIITTIIIWYAFYKLLRVPLPWGVLTNYAF